MNELSTNSVRPQPRPQQGKPRGVSLRPDTMKPFMSGEVSPKKYDTGFHPERYPGIKKLETKAGQPPLQTSDLGDIAASKARAKAAAEIKVQKAAAAAAKRALPPTGKTAKKKRT